MGIIHSIHKSRNSSCCARKRPEKRPQAIIFDETPRLATHLGDTTTPPPHLVVAQEMKDRETKRWLLGDFVKENEIRAVEIEMAYKRFKNLAPSSGSGGKQATSSVEMDFKTWILVSSNVLLSGLVVKL